MEFGQATNITSVKLYLFADEKLFFAPDSISIEYKTETDWKPAKASNIKLIGNTANVFQLQSVSVKAIRINFFHQKEKQVAITEVEMY